MSDIEVDSCVSGRTGRGASRSFGVLGAEAGAAPAPDGEAAGLGGVVVVGSAGVAGASVATVVGAG